MKYSISIMIIALLLLIILIVYRRILQSKSCICKQCKNIIGQNDNFCRNCGADLKQSNKEIIIRKSNMKIFAGICILIAIIVISGIMGVVSYSRNGSLLYDLSGSTGIYKKKYDNTLSNTDYWLVDCEALSKGTFKKSVRNKNIESLIVEGRTTEGKMVLTIECEGNTQEYDISDTDGEQVIDVSEFESGLLKMAISHPKSEHIFVCVKWK